MGVNGNTITKSKYPERQQYYKENPKLTDRRAVRNPETGEAMNFEEDDNGNKISSAYTPFGVFKKDTYNKIHVNDDGTTKYSNEQTARLKKLSPFKIFTNIIINTYWNNHIKTTGKLQDVPKHLRMKLYGLLRKFTWTSIKNHVIQNTLGMNIPNNEEERKFIESTQNFKQALDILLTNILKNNPENIYGQIDNEFNKAIVALRVQPERQEVRIQKQIWANKLEEYGISQQDLPFEQIIAMFNQQNDYMFLEDFMDYYITAE